MTIIIFIVFNAYDYLDKTKTLVIIWKFPEIGVPLNHPLDMGFPIKTIHFRDPP